MSAQSQSTALRRLDRAEPAAKAQSKTQAKTQAMTLAKGAQTPDTLAPILATRG